MKRGYIRQVCDALDGMQASAWTSEGGETRAACIGLQIIPWHGETEVRVALEAFNKLYAAHLLPTLSGEVISDERPALAWPPLQYDRVRVSGHEEPALRYIFAVLNAGPPEI